MHNTYILFSENKIVGPVFTTEINKVCNEHFGQIKPVMLEESLFKLQHPEKYKQQFKKYWIDFVVAKLINTSFVGKFMNSLQNRSIYNHWFNITQIAEDGLLFTYSHEADRQYVAALLLELSEYVAGIYNLHLGDKFYVSRSKNEILFGKEADMRLIAESTYYCPN